VTPKEILRDLRDIHLPAEQAAETAGSGIVLWPAGLVVIVASLAGWMILRRRTAWRREALEHLDAIEHKAVAGQKREGWIALATLLRRIAIRTSDRQDEVASLVGQAWLAKLDQLFDTDVFLRGPGRAIVRVPYGDHAEVDSEEEEHQADELQATIDGVRKRLPYLQAMR
jgi:hypothetical protein